MYYYQVGTCPILQGFSECDSESLLVTYCSIGWHCFCVEFCGLCFSMHPLSFWVVAQRHDALALIFFIGLSMCCIVVLLLVFVVVATKLLVSLLVNSWMHFCVSFGRMWLLSLWVVWCPKFVTWAIIGFWFSYWRQFWFGFSLMACWFSWCTWTWEWSICYWLS